MRKMMIAAGAIALGATPALAQNVDLSGGLVDVTIQDVSILNNFLNDSQVALLDNVSVPVTVQVPIGVAANVCGVNANVLAEQERAGGAECTASNGSRALAQNFITQVLEQKRGRNR